MLSNKLDWAAIQAQFESGEYSGRAIAREHGFSYTALQDKAKAENWRVPKAKVTSGLIPAHPPSVLDRPLPALDPPATGDNPDTNPSEPMTSVARTPTDIVEDGQAMILRLLSELDASTAHIGQLHELIEEYTTDDRDNRRRDAMLRAVNLLSRSTIIKNLAAAASPSISFP